MQNRTRGVERYLVVLAALALAATSAAAQSLPVTSGLTLWLKADAITGLSNGQSVSLWSDSSPNGNNATQLNLANEPVYVTGALNGLPVVRFNGPLPGSVPGEFLTTPTMSALANMSVYMVARSADALNRYVLTFGDDVHAVIQGFNFTTPALWEWFQTPRTTLGTVDTTRFQVISFTNANASASSWLIGSDGFTSPFNGDMAEVIVYNRSLSPAENQSVIQYLDAKWIPEPSTAGLLGIGVLLLWRRKS